MSKYTWMKRLAALACAGAFVLCFAACGNTEKEPESTAPSDTAPVSETETETETDTLPPDDAQPSDADPQPNPDGLTTPQTKDEIVALYAKALKQSNLKRTSVKRTLGSGSIKALGQTVDLTEPDYRPTFEATDDASGWPTPAAFDAASVSSATFKEEGGARVLTFRLNTQSGSQDLKQSTGGHIGFVDYDRVSAMIKNETDKLKVNVTVKNIALTLNDGVLTVTLDGTSDVVKKISYSCSESITVNAEWKKGILDVAVNADINYSNISVEYAG